MEIIIVILLALFIIYITTKTKGEIGEEQVAKTLEEIPRIQKNNKQYNDKRSREK